MRIPKARWEETRSSLLEAVKDPEDRAAWGRFFEQYAGFVYRIASRRLPPEDAEEVTMTVLAEVAAKGEAGFHDPAKGKFRSWLSACTWYRVRDVWRKRRLEEARFVQAGSLDGSSVQALGEAALAEAPDEFAAMADEEWRGVVREHALALTKGRVAARAFEIFHALVIEEWPMERVMATWQARRDAVYQAKRRVGRVYAAALKEAEAALDAPFGTETAP